MSSSSTRLLYAELEQAKGSSKKLVSFGLWPLSPCTLLLFFTSLPASPLYFLSLPFSFSSLSRPPNPPLSYPTGAYEIDIIFNLASLIMASLVVSGVLHTKLVWISAVLLQVRYLRVSLNIRNACRTFHGVAASVTSLLVVVAIAIHVYATIGTGLFSNLDCCEAADEDNSGSRRQLMWRMLAGMFRGKVNW